MFLIWIGSGTGTAVGASETTGADGHVECESAPAKGGRVELSLCVAQLAPVEGVSCGGAVMPAEEDITGRLHQSLSMHDALGAGLEPAAAEVRLENRLPRGLLLENDRVVLGASFQ